MQIVLLTTILLILTGAILMAVAIYRGQRARAAVPQELHGRWNIMLLLMTFFLVGYVAIVLILAGGMPVPAEFIIGPVFFGGALFVLIVINVSREAISNMKAAQEELSRANESLEQRVADRTQQLRQAHTFLRTVMDSMHDGVSIIDAKDYRIVGVNAAFLRSVKRTEQDVIGKRCYEVTHEKQEPCGPPDDNCPLQETLRTGLYAEHEHIHYSSDGTKQFVDVSTSPLLDNDNNLIQVVHVQRDVTARRRAEELRERATLELRTTNEEMKSFVYSVSHDLRAPLVNVKGFTVELNRTLNEAIVLIETFVRGLPEERQDKLKQLLKEDVPEAVEFISTSIDRMDGLISAMLKLSRHGARELQMEPLDMDVLTRFLLETLAHQIEKKQVAVAIKRLPTVVADNTAMEQIMGNLLDNALKYLQPGQPGKLEISAEQTEQEMIFRVKDNGRGIAQDDLTRIFEIFRRAGKQDVPGEGMGLSYVKALVRKHGGRIWCESELGKGSTFIFTLPRSPLFND
jgi:PAS domain S-box-containing protein